MGPDDDPMSVLDPRNLCVRKVTNLRVADCSSMPDIPAANTNLPAIMIGERCADLITQGPLW
jgi:choline dehydrogenase